MCMYTCSSFGSKSSSHIPYLIWRSSYIINFTMSTFWATPQARLGEELSIFAQRVSKVRKVQSLSQMTTNTVQREAVVQLVDRLIKQPDIAPGLLLTLNSQAFNTHASAPVSTPSTEKPSVAFTSFGRMTVDTKAAFLAYLLPNKVTREMLDGINRCDDMAIGDIFFLIFKLKPTDKVPKEFKNWNVACLAMKYRAHEVGDRLEGWWDKSVDEDTGVVNWAADPLYVLSWTKEGSLEKVKHSFTGDEERPKEL